MTKDQEMLQNIREKVLIRMMREHLKEETEKLKEQMERLQAKLQSLR
jgi:hypothetical protein